MKIQKANLFSCKRQFFISEEYKSETGIYSENHFKIIENESRKIKSTMEYCDFLLDETERLINKHKRDCEIEIRSRWEEHESERIEATHREEKTREAEAKKQSINFMQRSADIMKRWSEEIEGEKRYLQIKSQEMVFEAIYKLMKEAPDRKKIKALLSHLKLEVMDGESTVLNCHERHEKKIRDCLNAMEINQWQVKIDNECNEYDLRLTTKDEDLWISWDALMSLCNADILYPPGNDTPGGVRSGVSQ